MEFNNRLRRILGLLTIIFALGVFLVPDYAEARRKSSFGGRSRSSFKTKSSRPKSSFGSKRSKSTSFGTKGSRKTSSGTRLNKNSRTSATRTSVPRTKQSSFGGSRLNNQKAYTSKYGAPRKTSTYNGTNAAGGNQRYVMNDYGGYGSGLMTGYMMGRTSLLWSMPFHPAFYYSRPYYVNNPDGTIGVYPPTFSFSKLIFILIILGIIILIIRAKIRAKKRKALGGGGNYSSFG